jgi:hypothetical protein
MKFPMIGLVRPALMYAVLVLAGCGFDNDSAQQNTSQPLAGPGNAAPVVSGAPPATVQATAAYAFQPSASDPDGDTLTFAIANKPAWAAFNPSSGALTGTPGNADIGTTVDVRISVSDGRASAFLSPFAIEVREAPSAPPAGNSSPAISGTAPGRVTAGQAYSFQPSASDPDGDSLAFAIANKPSWATFRTGTGRLSGTPGAGHVGTYPGIVISVGDGTTSTSLAGFTITVDPLPNSAPTIAGTPATTATGGQPYTFTPAAADADGNPLAFSIQNQPAWASFSSVTGSLAGTPGAAHAGIHAGIVISVSDGALTTSLPAFAITVAAAPVDNQAPSVPQALSAVARGSSRIDLAWSASSDNVGVTGYTVYRDGASVATTSATSYADNGLAAGSTYSYAIAAFDAAGNGSAQSASASATTQAATNGFNFVTYGDSRADSDCAGNAVHIGLVNRMLAEDPAFAVNNGDMITGFSNTTNFVQDGACTAPDRFGSLKDIIAPLQERLPPPGLPTAYFPVIGNHDDNWGSGWYPDPFGNGICDVFNLQALVPNHTQQGYFSGVGQPRRTNSEFHSLACSTSSQAVYPQYIYYSFDHANSHFIVLRINNDEYDLEDCGSCGANRANYSDYSKIHQLDFLRADLAAARANPSIENIFVFLHAPLFGSSSGHPNNPSWRTLGREFSASGVKAVFSGHSHVYERSVPVRVDDASPDGTRDDQAGTVYVTTGGGGSSLHGFGATPWYSARRLATYHFVDVQVSGTTVTLRAIDRNGAVIDSYAW